jgi:GT2 family glycosyltransferase
LAGVLDDVDALALLAVEIDLFNDALVFVDLVEILVGVQPVSIYGLLPTLRQDGVSSFDTLFEFLIEALQYCLLFLNPDAVLGTGSLEKLLNYFARNTEAAIIGCALIGHKGEPERSCWKTPCLKTIFLESILPYEMSLKLVTEKPAGIRRVEMVSGACMAVRRQVFQSLGGFDERFFIYYEDADFCLRARSLDYGIYYFPEVQVVHRGRESFSDDLGMFFKMIYLSKIKFIKKHMKPAAAFLANVIIFGGILMRIPAYAIAGSVFFNMELLRLSKYHTFLLFRILKGS